MAADKRDAIVREATRLFVKHGYRAVGIAEILRAKMRLCTQNNYQKLQEC